MTEEVAGGPADVAGARRPVARARRHAAARTCVDVAEPASSVWPRRASATANPRSDPEFRSSGPIWVVGSSRLPSCLVDGVNPALLAYALHLPPSAVPLVSDYRFRRSAQRLGRLTL
jgi:hypothetical protein